MVEVLSYFDAAVRALGGHTGAGDGLDSFCERDTGLPRQAQAAAPGRGPLGTAVAPQKGHPLRGNTRARAEPSGGTGRGETRSCLSCSGLGHWPPLEASRILSPGRRLG